MTVPVIETERVILRPLKITDAQIIYNNWTSDPDVAKYVRWSTHSSASETVKWLTAEEAAMVSGNHYSWGFVLKENMELFGCGSLAYSDAHGMFELGYNIMKKYWNKGLTSEAAEAITAFAANLPGVTCLFAVHAKENVASARVLEKLGFIYQNDSAYTSFDGENTYLSREYLLAITPTAANRA